MRTPTLPVETIYPLQLQNASCFKTQREHTVTRLPYLPLGLDRLGEELHVLELGGGAEGLHALGGPEEPLQQVRVQGPRSLLGETTRPFY